MKARELSIEDTLTLSVILYLAPALEPPAKGLGQDRRLFCWMDATVRKQAMKRFFQALPPEHRLFLSKKNRHYCSPEAMALWSKWNGLDG